MKIYYWSSSWVMEMFPVTVKYFFFCGKCSESWRGSTLTLLGCHPGCRNLHIWGSVMSTAWTTSWFCLKVLSNGCHGQLIGHRSGRGGKDWEEGFFTVGRPWSKPRSPRPRSHPWKNLGEALPCTGFLRGRAATPPASWPCPVALRWTRPTSRTQLPLCPSKLQLGGLGPGGDAAWQSMTHLLTSLEVNITISWPTGWILREVRLRTRFTLKESIIGHKRKSWLSTKKGGKVTIF